MFNLKNIIKKEVGASPKFTTLIEGESLVNDGTAILIYDVLLRFQKGMYLTTSKIILNFI